MSSKKRRVFYILFIVFVLVVVILNVAKKDPLKSTDQTIHKASDKTPNKINISEEDVDQVYNQSKPFAESYFSYTNVNPNGFLENSKNFLHSRFKDKRKQIVDEINMPNRAGIQLVASKPLKIEVFSNKNQIGLEEQLITSIVKMKVEDTYLILDKTEKKQIDQDFIIFWAKEKNKWKVIDVRDFDPDAIYDY
ncbi:hypothetical protein [Thermoflavimicrobium daqui]|uniref:Uncharacterized protein n=1 Tax=Thermoflavimicrobium daqui TaxID=2137476 RepID=A0A364K1M8_9BACL|nr:hypothetical protein [Thermoflavimicrobium daqui]RAL21931.1 hypothetical protein DL897_15175 [Thermoflavimicrobium daqui]